MNSKIHHMVSMKPCDEFRVHNLAHVTKKFKNHKKPCESDENSVCEKTIVSLGRFEVAGWAGCGGCGDGCASLMKVQAVFQQNH